MYEWFRMKPGELESVEEKFPKRDRLATMAIDTSDDDESEFEQQRPIKSSARGTTGAQARRIPSKTYCFH